MSTYFKTVKDVAEWPPVHTKTAHFCRQMLRTVDFENRTLALRGEWPSGLYCLCQVTEVKLGRVLRGLTSQLAALSFGRDVKLGVPCLDAACTVGLN